MRYLLFFVGDSGLDRPFSWQWIGKWAAIYRVHPVVVDPDGLYRTKEYPPYCFHSLRDAIEHPDLSSLDWVWLDPGADTYWDEVSLPRDNVIYCLGSDADGFGGEEFPGKRVKMRPPEPDYEGEWYAAMVAPLLLFEVYGK